MQDPHSLMRPLGSDSLKPRAFSQAAQPAPPAPARTFMVPPIPNPPLETVSKPETELTETIEISAPPPVEECSFPEKPAVQEQPLQQEAPELQKEPDESVSDKSTDDFGELDSLIADVISGPSDETDSDDIPETDSFIADILSRSESDDTNGDLKELNLDDVAADPPVADDDDDARFTALFSGTEEEDDDFGDLFTDADDDDDDDDDDFGDDDEGLKDLFIKEPVPVYPAKQPFTPSSIDPADIDDAFNSPSSKSGWKWIVFMLLAVLAGYAGWLLLK